MYHNKRYVYKFYSSKTDLNYIVLADEHAYNFFAIKFYVQRDRKLDYKYSRVVNKGDVSNILVTVSKCIVMLLKRFPNASFGFIGSRTIDYSGMRVEKKEKNQRFNIYSHHIPAIIGEKTFKHRAFKESSSYLLLNRINPDLTQLERNIIKEVQKTYPSLLNYNIT